MKGLILVLTSLILTLTGTALGGPETIDNAKYINAGGVLMMVTNQGSLGWDLDEIFGYSVGTFYPYTSVENIQNGTEAKSPLCAAGLWLGGKVGGETRATVAEYAGEYTPGPMAAGSFMPDAYSNDAYRVYKLFVDSGSNNPNADYSEWPVDQGAPVDDYGRPSYMIDQTLWTVFNDADPARHTVPPGDTPPLGIEVHQTVWAANFFGDENIIYVKYKLYNKGSNNISEFYIGFWIDPDIGWREDDRSGCDTTRDIFYVYNANNNDASYGAAPPAFGARLVYGPMVASLSDTAWFDGASVPGYRNLRLSSATGYINGVDPNSAVQTYNCLTGLLPDGSPQPSGGLFCYPGDPVAGTGSLDPLLTDKKIVGAVGPLTFNPGDSQCVLIKLAVGQGADNLGSLTDLIQVLSAPDDIVADVEESPRDGLPEGYALLPNYPNPFNPGTTIDYVLPERAEVRITIYNVLGQRVKTLVDQLETAGSHSVTWDGTDDRGRPQASGVYLYRAKLGEVSLTRKMTLIK